MLFQKYESMKEKISEGRGLDSSEYNDILDYIHSEIDIIKLRQTNCEDELDSRFADIQLQILKDVKDLINLKTSLMR